MRPYSDAEEHEHGSFLEYGGVEPERLAVLERAAALAGPYGTIEPPGNWEQVQVASAARLKSLRELRPELARLASDPADGLAPVLESFDRTWSEAEPYLRRPERVVDRRLGDLHLDLMHCLDDAMVIALRLVRGGASPVMPVRRWIGHATSFEIWQRALSKRPGLFFGTLDPARSLVCCVSRVTILRPPELAAAAALDWAGFALDFRGMRAQKGEYNADQAARGGVQLYVPEPRDAREEREDAARHDEEHAAFRRVAVALAADLRDLLREGRVYVGWSRSYDYD